MPLHARELLAKATRLDTDDPLEVRKLMTSQSKAASLIEMNQNLETLNQKLERLIGVVHNLNPSP